MGFFSEELYEMDHYLEEYMREEMKRELERNKELKKSIEELKNTMENLKGEKVKLQKEANILLKRKKEWYERYETFQKELEKVGDAINEISVELESRPF